MAGAVRIAIDPVRCQGHGRCWETAPELVEDDEDGRGVVRGDGVVAPGREDQARAALNACPERAVLVTEG